MHRSRIRLRCFLSSRFDLGEAAKPVNPAVVSAFSPVKKWVLFVFLLILQLFGGWIIGKIESSKNSVRTESGLQASAAGGQEPVSASLG